MLDAEHVVLIGQKNLDHICCEIAKLLEEPLSFPSLQQVAIHTYTTAYCVAEFLSALETVL